MKENTFTKPEECSLSRRDFLKLAGVGAGTAAFLGSLPKVERVLAADVELLSAVQAVLQGEIYIHPSMTKSLVEDLLPHSGDTTTKDEWDLLSEREQEVLKLVALGHTSAEIAEKLSLSAKTVETYRARGMEKLGLHSRAALVRFALKNGLISGE